MKNVLWVILIATALLVGWLYRFRTKGKSSDAYFHFTQTIPTLFLFLTALLALSPLSLNTKVFEEMTLRQLLTYIFFLYMISLGSIWGRAGTEFRQTWVRFSWMNSNDAIWRRTQRFVGWQLIITGILFVVIYSQNPALLKRIGLYAAALLILLPQIYSFSIWKKEFPSPGWARELASNWKLIAAYAAVTIFILTLQP